jgi:hypothetical protein
LVRAPSARNVLKRAFCLRRSVSLSVHCDKRKEKDRLFVGAGAPRRASRRLLRWLYLVRRLPVLPRRALLRVLHQRVRMKIWNQKVPPTGGRICRTHIQARLRCAGPRQLISPEIAAPVGRKLGVSDGVLDSIVLPSQTDASRGNESASSRADVVPGLAANHNGQPPLDLDCARKALFTVIASDSSNIKRLAVSRPRPQPS